MIRVSTDPPTDEVTDPADGDAADVDTDRLKAALGRLAGPDTVTVIERADAAVDDLDVAVEFVESVGVSELEAAVETVDDATLRRRGESALAAFRRFGQAAAGDLTPEQARRPDHFRPGRGTDLRGDDEGSSR